jgi:hypothetical protein
MIPRLVVFWLAQISIQRHLDLIPTSATNINNKDIGPYNDNQSP